MAKRVAFAAVPSYEHNDPTHPENSSRVPAIIDGLSASGLLAEMIPLEVAPAAREQLLSCHASDYIASLERRVSWGPAVIDPAPTYVTGASFEAALNAVGGALAAVDAVIDGHADGALALVRPPGHHALREHAMGFCLFNNTALAAIHAREAGCSRVLIYDFDVHHGNGTQSMFYKDGSVLFASTHQWGIYPGTGSEMETGTGDGEGLTLNIPLPLGAGDDAVGRAQDELLGPAAERFQPEMVIVSAGFDAHFRDPLAGLQYTGPGFHGLARFVTEIAERYAEGRIVFLLEGGYDLPALANGVVNVVRALRKEGPDTSLGSAPFVEPDVRPILDRLRAVHQL